MCWFGNVVRDRTVGVEPVHNVPFEHGDHAICVIDHKGHDVALGQSRASARLPRSRRWR